MSPTEHYCTVLATLRLTLREPRTNVRRRGGTAASPGDAGRTDAPHDTAPEKASGRLGGARSGPRPGLRPDLRRRLSWNSYQDAVERSRAGVLTATQVVATHIEWLTAASLLLMDETDHVVGQTIGTFLPGARAGTGPA